MGLNEALRMLCEVHTRDDDEIGFTIVMGATPSPGDAAWYDRNYAAAWETVRAHLGLPHAPPELPRKPAS